MLIICLILGYIICGILSYGFLFAYNQKEFYLLAEDDYKQDIFRNMLYGITGPISLLTVICLKQYKYGLKFW